MKKLYKALPFLSVSALLAPVAAFAQNQFGGSTVATGTTAANILGRIADLLNIIIPILITLGVVAFIYGVVTYIFSKDEEKKKESRGFMLNAIVGLFVILAIWGIIGLLSRTLGVGVGGTLQQSQIPGVSN